MLFGVRSVDEFPALRDASPVQIHKKPSPLSFLARIFGIVFQSSHHESDVYGRESPVYVDSPARHLVDNESDNIDLSLGMGENAFGLLLRFIYVPHSDTHPTPDSSVLSLRF